MKVLAIETSCDETGIALLSGAKTETGFVFETHKHALLSQAQMHAEYGGVYPNLAKREHIKNLPILFREFAGETFDAVVVTEGPGLEPALWTGIEFAKRVAAERGVPLFGVNHMEGHLISSLAKTEHSNILENTRMKLEGVQFPVLGLLISGGHTEFVLMLGWFQYEIVGQTLDDAVGEAFDKVARMLGLPYPGGPHISKLAEKHRKETLSEKSLAQGLRREASLAGTQTEDPRGLFEGKVSWSLPRPMLQSGTCDVSFSGLKTAALYALREYAKATPSRAKESPLTPDEKAAFAREFEDAVAEVFVSKTRRALEQTGARTFVIGGGVAANSFIRAQLQELLQKEFGDVEVRLPEVSITGDNAVMIAEAALVHLLSGDWKLSDEPKELKATGSLALGEKTL